MFPLAAAADGAHGLGRQRRHRCRRGVPHGRLYEADDVALPGSHAGPAEDKTLFPTQPPFSPRPTKAGARNSSTASSPRSCGPPCPASYPIDAHRQTLFGHSLGGLFVLGVMFKHPESFKNYVASSPSIWWDKRSGAKGRERFSGEGKEPKAPHPCVDLRRLQGEQDPYSEVPPGAGNMSLSEVNKKIAEAQMVGSARDLAVRLAPEPVRSRDSSCDSRNFSAEDHLSVVPAAISRSLGFALEP